MKRSKFYDALAEGNVTNVTTFVTHFVGEIIEAINNNKMENSAESVITMMQQTVDRAKKYINLDSISFELGRLQGAIEVSGQLYQDEAEINKIEELLTSHQSYALNILKEIKNSDQYIGIQHGELAKRLSISPSLLSNHMKYMVKSGTVAVSRTGKNTFYSLTGAGRKYCEKVEGNRKEIAKEKDVAELVKSLYKLTFADSKDEIKEDPKSISTAIRVVERKQYNMKNELYGIKSLNRVFSSNYFIAADSNDNDVLDEINFDLADIFSNTLA